MKRNSKSKDYKLENKTESLRKEFYACYDILKRYDAECIIANDSCCDTTWGRAQDQIDELEQLQRNIIIRMMAINVDLKIKDKVVDTYLQHLVYVLGL